MVEFHCEVSAINMASLSSLFTNDSVCRTDLAQLVGVTVHQDDPTYLVREQDVSALYGGFRERRKCEEISLTALAELQSQLTVSVAAIRCCRAAEGKKVKRVKKSGRK